MNKINIGKDLYLKGRIGWQGLSKDEYLEISEYKIINATSLMDGYVDWSNCGYITKERYEEAKEIQLQENDILISKDGTLGKIGYVKNITTSCSVASGIFVLRNVKPSLINFDYLYHVLKSPIFKDFIKRNKALGSTIPHLYQRDLENFEIGIPDLAKQTKIAKVLNLLDSKIENNKKINIELESMAKTLYDYWFLQFEFPNEEGKPYKSSGGKMVYNKELKREIPEGWTIRTVLDCSNVVSGYPFKTETYSNEGRYNIYTIGNVQDGYIDDTCPNKIDFIPNDIDERCVLKPCDVIMSLTGNVGRVGIVYTKNALLNQRVLKVIPFDGYHNFLYLLFRNSSFMNVMQRIASGTSQKNLSPNQVCDFTFAVPNKNLLDLFNLKLNGFIDAIVNNLSQNQELTSLRDFLLPLLMNGQVTFKENKLWIG